MDTQAITDYKTSMIQEQFGIGILKQVMENSEAESQSTLNSMPAPEIRIPGIGENIDIFA